MFRRRIQLSLLFLVLLFAAPAAVVAEPFLDLHLPLSSAMNFLRTSEVPHAVDASLPHQLPELTISRPDPIWNPFSLTRYQKAFFPPVLALDLSRVPYSVPRSSAGSPSATSLNLLPLAPCYSPVPLEVTALCRVHPYVNAALWPSSRDSVVANPILPAGLPKERFHWGPALWQSFEFLVVEHAFRLANDPYARYLLFHKPLWHDYLVSADHFYMNQWGDGDSFLVNYIGHPMEGAVSGYIFLQNDPQGRSAKFGKSSAYWQSRLKAMAWAAVYSAYFEIGPVLSEAALGNEGGYTYVPQCGMYPTCKKIPGKEYKPPTNNTGWVDFVVTPTVGLGWIILEDAIETEFVDRLAKGSHAAKFNILRGALAPSHTFSNAMAGKAPWYRYHEEKSFTSTFGGPLQPVKPRPLWKDDPRWDFGVHYVAMNLPMDREGCSSCRSFASGTGLDLSYRATRLVYLDSEFNLFPGSSSSGSNGSAQEALVGLKIGYTSHSWGVFSQVRPGVIHYDKTLVPGSSTNYESVTRFALDLGGSIEYYASRHSTFRFRVGTTLIHYLTDHPDPKQPPVSVLSDQYYTLQGSPYLSTGYLFRF
jgi:hypothetical protein